MANAIIGYPIFSDPNAVVAPALSGGSWALPLTNLQDRRLAEIARSTTAALKDTRFSIDLLAERRVGVVAIPKHTLSRNAKARVMGTNSDQFNFFYEAGEDIAGKGGTFARGSGAYYTDQNGVLVAVGNNVLRDGHFLNGKRTVLLEDAGTNLAFWSQDAANAAWTKSGATILTDIGVAPDQTQTMDILVESAANAEHYMDQAAAGVVANNTVMSASVFTRQYGAIGVPYFSNVRVSIVLKDGVTVLGATFDTGTGAVSNVSAGVTPHVFLEYLPGLGTCYRCSVTANVGAGGSTPRIRIQTVNPNTGAIVYAGNVNCGVAVWGMQLEGWFHATSYMFSNGGIGSRNADVLTFPVGTLVPAAAWSAFFKAINLSKGLGATYWWGLGAPLSAATGPVFALGGDNGAGNYVTSRYTDAGGALYDAAGGNAAPGIGDEFEVVSTWSGVQLATQYSLNGSAVTGATSALFANPGGVWAGTNVLVLGGANAFMAFESLRIVPGTALTMAPARTLVYDSGWLDVWPAVYPPGSLPADDPRMVTGKYSAEEALDINIGFTLVLSPPQIWKYLNVQLSDAGNADGHVDLARLAVCGAYQPSLNFIEGAKIDLSTASSREESDGGAAIFDEKPQRRTAAFTLEGPEDEMLVNTFDFKRRVGITKQFMWVWDGADTYHMPRRSWLAVLKELSGLEAPYTKRGSSAYAAIEEL